MQIILLHNKTALLRDDRKTTVTIYPNGDGQEQVSMEIEGQRFCLKEGSPIPKLPELIGHVGVTITDRYGLRYKAESVRMVAGVPYTLVDFTAGFYDMALEVDRQVREIERITQELLDLRAMIQPDALGFLNIGNNGGGNNE